MKKLNRNEKAKLIEHIKTSLICVLFVCSLYFGYQIISLYRDQTINSDSWWGTNSSTVAEGDVLKGENSSEILQKLSAPQLIAVNFGDDRLVKDVTYDDFDSLAKEIDLLIMDAYSRSAENTQKVGENEWIQILGENSVFAQYSYSRSPVYENVLFNGKNQGIKNNIEAYNSVAILGDKLFFKCLKTGNVTRVDLSRSIDVKGISKSGNAGKFAYELELNQPGGTIVNRDVLLLTESLAPRELKVSVPRVYTAGLNYTKVTEFTSGIINIFGYNPNTIRQYVGEDGSLIFVGETGTLSMSPNGILEYKALGKTEGINLSLSQKGQKGAVIYNLYGIVESILAKSGLDAENRAFDISLTQIPTSIDVDTTLIYRLDYFADGIRVELGDGAGVYALVENGILTDFRMNIKDIDLADARNEMESVFDVIERAIPEQTITAVTPLYKINDRGAQAVWSTKGEN